MSTIAVSPTGDGGGAAFPAVYASFSAAGAAPIVDDAGAEAIALMEGPGNAFLTSLGLAKLLACAQLHLVLSARTGLSATTPFPLAEARLMIQLAAFRRRCCYGDAPVKVDEHGDRVEVRRQDLRLDAHALSRFLFTDFSAVSRSDLVLVHRYASPAAAAGSREGKAPARRHRRAASGDESEGSASGEEDGLRGEAPATFALEGHHVFLSAAGVQLSSLVKAARAVIDLNLPGTCRSPPHLRGVALSVIVEHARASGALEPLPSLVGLEGPLDWLHPAAAAAAPMALLLAAPSINHRLFGAMEGSMPPLAAASTFRRAEATSAGWVVANRAARAALRTMLSTADGRLVVLRAVYGAIASLGQGTVHPPRDDASATLTPAHLAAYCSILLVPTLHPADPPVLLPAAHEAPEAPPIGADRCPVMAARRAAADLAALLPRSQLSALTTRVTAGPCPHALLLSPAYWCAVCGVEGPDAPVSQEVFWGLCELGGRGRDIEMVEAAMMVNAVNPTGRAALGPVNEFSIGDWLTLLLAWEVLLSQTDGRAATIATAVQRVVREGAVVAAREPHAMRDPFAAFRHSHVTTAATTALREESTMATAVTAHRQLPTTAIAERAVRMASDALERPPVSQLWIGPESATEGLDKGNSAPAPLHLCAQQRTVLRSLRASAELRSDRWAQHHPQPATFASLRRAMTSTLLAVTAHACLAGMALATLRIFPPDRRAPQLPHPAAAVIHADPPHIASTMATLKDTAQQLAEACRVTQRVRMWPHPAGSHSAAASEALATLRELHEYVAEDLRWHVADLAREVCDRVERIRGALLAAHPPTSDGRPPAIGPAARRMLLEVHRLGETLPLCVPPSAPALLARRALARRRARTPLPSVPVPAHLLGGPAVAPAAQAVRAAEEAWGVSEAEWREATRRFEEVTAARQVAAAARLEAEAGLAVLKDACRRRVATADAASRTALHEAAANAAIRQRETAERLREHCAALRHQLLHSDHREDGGAAGEGTMDVLPSRLADGFAHDVAGPVLRALRDAIAAEQRRLDDIVRWPIGRWGQRGRRVLHPRGIVGHVAPVAVIRVTRPDDGRGDPTVTLSAV